MDPVINKGFSNATYIKEMATVVMNKGGSFFNGISINAIEIYSHFKI